MADVVTTLTALYEGRAWQALSYPSWSAYCSSELTTAALRWTVRDRAEVAGALRAAGASMREIAATVGVSVSTVHGDLHRAGVRDRTAEPETITGADGKTYPARRRVPEPLDDSAPAEPSARFTFDVDPALIGDPALWPCAREPEIDEALVADFQAALDLLSGIVFGSHNGAGPTPDEWTMIGRGLSAVLRESPYARPGTASGKQTGTL